LTIFIENLPFCGFQMVGTSKSAANIIMKFSVDIIGTYPPPIGGTSIHLQRLQRRNRENDIDSIVYDTRPYETGKQISDSDYIKPIKNYKQFLLGYFFNRRADIIHSHSHSWVERMILTLKAKSCGQKVIFTFHSFRDEREKFSSLQKIAYRFTVRFADKFIATGMVVKDKMIAWGIKESKIALVMPFIAPSRCDGTTLPVNVVDFVNKYDIILAANASNNDHYNGDDLYGMDMCIELLHSLSDKCNVGLVYVLTKTTDKDYLMQLKDRIKGYHLSEKFLLYEGSLDFISLLKQTSIFIRPTNTDSWGISMSESLSLGVPCVCSDVCKREDAAILFESRNQNDLNRIVEQVIGNYEYECNKLSRVPIKDNYDAVYNEYIRQFK